MLDPVDSSRVRVAVLVETLARSSTGEALAAVVPGARQEDLPLFRLESAGLLVFPSAAADVELFLRGLGILTDPPRSDDGAAAGLSGRHGSLAGDVKVHSLRGRVYAWDARPRFIEVHAVVPGSGVRLPAEISARKRRSRRASYLGFSSAESMADLGATCRRLTTDGTLIFLSACYRE